jgi:putative hydrolase of the HAD superfamily
VTGSLTSPATTPATSSVTAVIWDIGGIVYVTPFEVFDRLESERGLPAGTLPRGPFGTDPDYRAVEDGRAAEPDYWAAMRHRLLSRGIDLDVHRDITWLGNERPEVLELMRTLQGRVRQAVLTNDASAFLGQGWQQHWPHRSLVDAVLDSLTLGVRKPHPDAFRAAAAAIGEPLHRCLFVDDLSVNVHAAREVGMQAVCFDVTDPAAGVRAVLRAVTG